MPHTCDQFSELLVDFTDGELSPSETQAVAAHLETCPTCRAQVARLRKSLALAQDLWKQYVADVAAAKPYRRASRRLLSVARWALPAAAVLLIAIGVGYWRPHHVQHAPAPVQPQSTSTADLEHEIAQSVVGAQLLAAADALADAPGGQPYACQRYAYVTETYAHTTSADVAQRRLDEVCNRRIEQ